MGLEMIDCPINYPLKNKNIFSRTF